jgi:hypothetical protein
MKQPNWRIPLVLAFCLLALGSFAYWLQFSHKPKSEHAETQKKKPIPLADDKMQIVQFRFKSAGGLIEGKCNNLALKTCTVATLGDWTITHPVTVKGDSQTIKDALSTATTMIASDMIDLHDETPEKRKQLLDEYGLSDDKRTKIGTEFIELTLENGHRMTAWFGEPYPIGDKVFVAGSVDGKINDENIFIVSNFYKTVFEKQVTYFRDKTVLNFPRPDITDIDAKTTNGKFTARFENGGWIINGKRGDHEQIDALLSAISAVRAKDFVPEDLFKGSRSIARYDLKSKANSYWLELFEKSSKPIHIKGKPEIPGESHYYVKSSGLTEPAEVDAGFRSQIDKKVSDLRYSVLMSDTESVTATTVNFAGKSFSPSATFHYDGKVWLQKDAGPKMDTLRVQKMLHDLSNERAKDIVSPAPAVSADALTVSVGDDKNPLKTHLVVYSVKGVTYVKDLTQNSNEAFVMGANEKNAFPFTPDSWKLK